MGRGVRAVDLITQKMGAWYVGYRIGFAAAG